MEKQISAKSFACWFLVLLILFMANISVRSAVSNQATECFKQCGSGLIVNTWTRSCGIEWNQCHITECSHHINDCGYGDNFNDVCYFTWYYCN